MKPRRNGRGTLSPERDSAAIDCGHHEGQHDGEHHGADDRDIPPEKELHNDEHTDKYRKTLECLLLQLFLLRASTRAYAHVMDEPYIPRQGSERDTLIAFLDYHRELLIDKASGLTDEQLHTTVAPSSLTLGGLINHMAVVEDSWFTDDIAGNPIPEPWASAPWEEDRDWELTSAVDTPTDLLFQRYRDAIERSNAVLVKVDDLSQLSIKTDRKGDPWSIRWILVHMIEETARHCGHADFIRESLDGSVGDFRSDES
jgi:uncharacterized damage-inducible protein DinB